MLLGALAVPLTYFGLHQVFGFLVDLPQGIGPTWFDLVWVMLCFVLLFALQCLIYARPRGRVARPGAHCH